MSFFFNRIHMYYYYYYYRCMLDMHGNYRRSNSKY